MVAVKTLPDFMLRACLERVRHEDQGVVVLAKSFFGAFGGSNKSKKTTPGS
jgi:hypothetical protein